ADEFPQPRAADRAIAGRRAAAKGGPGRADAIPAAAGGRDPALAGGGEEPAGTRDAGERDAAVRIPNPVRRLPAPAALAGHRGRRAFRALPVPRARGAADALPEGNA